MHTAMEPWKRTMPTFVLLLLGSISTNVHAYITKTATSGVFLEGSDVTLTCVVEGNGNAIWEDFSNATSIFVGKEKNTEKNKYHNFEISSGGGDFSLIIKDVQLSDEGTYVCKDRDRLAKATVSIGVLPYVYLSVKQSGASQAPQKSTDVNITCSAYKARPAVSVFELSVVGSEKTVNITNDKSNQNEDGKTYNSSASVSYIMSSEEMSVYCRVFTAGRSLSHTENFYIPRCNIIISGNEIRCLCQANPPVNTYYMDVNGNKHDGDVLFIEEVEPMNIRCFATNELGTGQSDRLFSDDMHSFDIVLIAVIVSVVVLLVVLTVIYIRCRLGPSEKISDAFPHVDEMKHVTITAVVFLLAITQGSAEFQCPSATFVELGKSVLIDCLISDVNDIYWLRGTEEDHYPIVKIEMGLKTISKIAQDHFDITDSGALVIRDASNDLTGSYVMLHYRTNHVKEVDTVTLNVTKLIDSIITQGPSGGVYPMGSTITLSCTFQKGYVVGWKEYENIDIFVADTKVTDDAKYDNFRVSLSDGISSLLIIGADLEDAGDYSCNTKSYAHVEIEAPPSLRIMFNVTDDEGNNSTESHGVIDITCIANNARPAVMIRFKTDGSEWINPSETWTVSNGVTFDTYATLKYSFQKNQTDVLLTCQTFGQTSVSAIEKTIHLYLPRCNITISGNEVRCTCQAKPPVDKYRMELNGNLQDGDVLYIEDSNSANVTCFGRNEMGTGLSSLQFHGDKAEAGFGIFSIVVTISVAVVFSSMCCLAVIFIKRRCSSRGEISDEEQPNEEETNELLPPPESKPDEKEQEEDAKEMSDRKNTNDEEASSLSPKLESSFTKTDLTSDLKDPQKFISKILLQVNKDWEIFAIEILNISEKVVKEAVMKNNNLEDQINAATKNMTSYHIEVLDENAELWEEFGFEYVKREKGCFLLHINDTQADLILEASRENVVTNISSSSESDDILVSCGIRIGKIGTKRLLEAFSKKCTRSADGVTILKTLEQTHLIRKPYVNLLRQLTRCKIYGARKILLLNFEKDLQGLKATIRNHVKNDWEIFAIEILDTPKKLVEDAVINYDTYEDQIEVVIREITVDHIELMDDINTHNKLEKRKLLSEFNLQSVEEGGRYYFKNMESTQSEKSSNEEIIYQQDPPTIESRDCMLKLCRERIGKVGIRRLLAALKTGNIETKDETNILKKLYEHGVINKSCANLLSKLSDCKLFRARKIVIAYLEADLWNYITNSICPQISVDWEIFAVDVLGLENCYVLEIIEHTKDEKEQVLSMFRKWRYMYGQRKEVSNQIIRDLIYAKKISSKIMSKDNRPKDNTALKVKPINEGGCSEDFLAMLTNCSKRIGLVGSKRFAEINSKLGILKVIVDAGVMSTSSEASEGISVDDIVNSLGQLCSMLSKANLYTARDVVITYIEKKLKEVITQISKKRASTWDKLAWYGLSLSNEDVVHIERAEKSDEERVRMAISKWMRKTEICEDVQQKLMEKAQITLPDLGI